MDFRLLPGLTHPHGIRLVRWIDPPPPGPLHTQLYPNPDPLLSVEFLTALSLASVVDGWTDNLLPDVDFELFYRQLTDYMLPKLPPSHQNFHGISRPILGEWINWEHMHGIYWR